MIPEPTAFSPRESFTRREALAILGAGLAAGSALAATEPSFKFIGIDHMILPAADMKRSLAFYGRIFGNSILKDSSGQNHHVKLGPNYVTLIPANSAKGHFCLGIQNFQVAEVKRSLDQAGIKSREVPGAGLAVTDPDGIPIELWIENSWALLSRSTSAVTGAADEPQIRPTQINHLLLAVAAPEKSAVFYAKIVGRPV